MDGTEEMKAGYAKAELVEDLLGKGEEFDYLRFLVAQQAVVDSRNRALAAAEDERAWKNLTMAYGHALLGKLTAHGTKSVVEDVVLEHSGKTDLSGKTVDSDTMSLTKAETLESMTDKFSKSVDAFKTAVADVQSQFTDQLSTLIATLERIEIEGE